MGFFLFINSYAKKFMGEIQETKTLKIGGKEIAIQPLEDRESVYFELSLTESQADKLTKQGVRVFQFKTRSEITGREIKKVYTIVKIEDFVKILPRR